MENSEDSEYLLKINIENKTELIEPIKNALVYSLQECLRVRLKLKFSIQLFLMSTSYHIKF